MTLWLDDSQKQSLTFIDNDTRTLTEVRLGAQGVDTNTSGTLYFDDFESRRFSYIGTLTDPGVDDPQATNAAGWFTRTYAYSATIPHAVTSVNPETGSPDTYEYDANGNMTCRIENGVVYTHAYNAENRASSVAKRNTNCTGTIIESWSFAYDGDGVRVMTAHFTGTSGTPDSTTAYYMGGAYEVKDSAVKKYYSIAGMMVAVNDGTAVQYMLTDHLGSTVAVTNNSGTLTSQQRYLPFGGARAIPNSPILGTDFGYTGQRKLDDGMGGIMDYRARFYSPALMRFLQPDTIIPDQFNPQSWNRYSYVLNQPINFNDPTGHYPTNCGPDNIYCGGLPENDYYHVSAPTNNGDDDDDIITDPDDESDSCTFDTCVADCIDGAWGCGTDVGGTWEDPAVYVAGGTACWYTGACLTAAAYALDSVYGSMATACLRSTVCAWLIGAVGGANQLTATNPQTCASCGTVRPDLVRNPGGLRIDSDGLSVFCRNCVGRGLTPLNPNGKYWIWTFDKFAGQASKYNLPGPTYSAPPPGHFSTWAGATGQVLEALSTWIRSGGKTAP